MDYLRIYFLTYNCGLSLIDIDHFSSHFFDAYPTADTTPPDLIVLSLQEIAPLAYSFLGGSFLTSYFTSYNAAVERAALSKWDTAYVNILTEHSGMTAQMVFARSDVVDHLSPVDIAKVGFGVQEIGNKGAVASRVSYSSGREEDTGKGVDLTLVAAHLAPMEDAVERRNRDWRSMVERLVFSSGFGGARDGYGDGNEESEALLGDSSNSGSDGKYPGIYAPSRHLFVGGDLNYRTADRFPTPSDKHKFPRADAEPEDPLHFTQLLKDDQLKREMGQSRCFHGLSEAPITFPPTYKYHHKAQAAARDLVQPDRVPEWKWTSHRWPSWCDRILFLDTPPGLGEEAKVRVLNYDALPVSPTSDHRPVALTVDVPVVEQKRTGEAQTIAPAPFSIDPDWARRRAVAEKKEYIAGCLAYLGFTREGNALALASAVGILGAWFVLRSLLSS
ncbi:putative inositol 5-phosphatase [Aspergillus stella-maris]|uniref:putative inositol 5-phosphatase n=1 Tax=Aspergillus stella-maris TaxID=1810926 RepID=UPI003CCD0661